MTDTYNLLNEELKVYYPDVTDAELNEMTDGLVEFFVIGTKAFYENGKNLINGFTNKNNLDIPVNEKVNN